MPIAKSNRSITKDAALRMSMAKLCSSRARCPAKWSNTPATAASRATKRLMPSACCLRRASGSRPLARISAPAAVARCSTSTCSGQTAAKQRVLEDALWHIARLKPEQIFPADRRRRLGLPVARTPFGAPRGEQRRCTCRIPREAQQLRRPDGFLRRAATPCFCT
jgi:hypothetical protein